jgi:5-methyltetrahydrofolate--homocysteine methyltransferase
MITMPTLPQFIASGKVLLLDGATGSRLIAAGLQPGYCPELWNIEQPDKVKNVARSYFEAGSDAVLTNTFGGSLLKLRDYGLEGRVNELNESAAELALSVKPAGRFVLASIGPCGKFMEPFGEVTRDQMTRSFAAQVKSLAGTGIDGFMLETFIAMDELLCAVRAIREHSSLPFFASMTFEYSSMGFNTIMGTSLAEAAEELSLAGALAVGSNCGNGLEKMIHVGKEFRTLSKDLHILIKSNAGEPVYRDGCTIYPEDPGFLEAHAGELFSFRPSVLGGCCGSDPEYISCLRRLIDLNNPHSILVS